MSGAWFGTPGWPPVEQAGKAWLVTITLRQPRPLLGLGLIVVSSACFGSSGPAAKAVLSAGFGPLQVAQARAATAAVVLMAALAVLRPTALVVRRGEWPLLLGYGVLAFFAIQTCYVLAVSRLPVAVALLLEYTGPVLVALWVRVVRRTVLPTAAWVGAGLTLAGLALVTQVWSGFRLDALGTAAGLAAATGLAAYFLLSEHGLSGGQRDPLGLVAWGALIGSVPLSVLAPPTSFPYAALATRVQLGPWTAPAWVPLLWLALVATVAAYLVGVAALKHLSAQVASVVATLEVLVATATAWLLLGEELGLAQLGGGAVLLAGVIVVQLRPPEPRSPRAAP